MCQKGPSDSELQNVPQLYLIFNKTNTSQSVDRLLLAHVRTLSRAVWHRHMGLGDGLSICVDHILQTKWWLHLNVLVMSYIFSLVSWVWHILIKARCPASLQHKTQTTCSSISIGNLQRLNVATTITTCGPLRQTAAAPIAQLWISQYGLKPDCFSPSVTQLRSYVNRRGWTGKLSMSVQDDMITQGQLV